jgi:fructose-bisphosphate aldolase, class II
MLVTLKEILAMADKGNFAVGAFNSPTLESARAALEAAEELGAPIILSHAEVHFEVTPIEIMGPILVKLAEEASVPVTVHLDHGSSLESVKKAINLGFSSVMIDASHKPYEENVSIVQEVVEFAHMHNISVEAELGVMTSSEIGGEESAHESEQEPVNIYTDPITAKDFVERTNIDALAASFGTVHGIYLQKPQLDYKRLQAIYENIKRPVVMHGGSGLSDEEYYKVIHSGVRKINYYSYAAKDGAEAVKKFIEENKNIFYHDLTVVAKEAMKQNVKRAIKVFQNTGVKEC